MLRAPAACSSRETLPSPFGIHRLELGGRCRDHRLRHRARPRQRHQQPAQQSSAIVSSICLHGNLSGSPVRSSTLGAAVSRALPAASESAVGRRRRATRTIRKPCSSASNNSTRILQGRSQARSTSCTATSRCWRSKPADAIRAAARAAGAADREVLVVEPGFKWDAFLGANANASLFGDRKCVDLRIPSGKPGAEGAQGARRLRGQSEPRQHHAGLAAARRSRDAVVGLVLGLAEQRRDDCRVSRRARRAARMDRGAARAPEAARVARDARVPRGGLRRQPARGAAGDREARAVAAGGRARPCRRRARRSPTSRDSTSSSSPKHGSPATPRVRCASCAR